MASVWAAVLAVAARIVGWFVAREAPVLEAEAERVVEAEVEKGEAWVEKRLGVPPADPPRPE